MSEETTDALHVENEGQFGAVAAGHGVAQSPLQLTPIPALTNPHSVSAPTTVAPKSASNSQENIAS